MASASLPRIAVVSIDQDDFSPDARLIEAVAHHCGANLEPGGAAHVSRT